jgi:cysteine desulfurase family protein (TIGR01976 family)
MHFETIVPQLRNQFPSLSRVDPNTGKPVIYLDGPAGSQVPLAVIDAISDYYRYHNANSAGMFPTSQETVALMTEAHRAAADWFGVENPQECIFGANMTTMTLAFSRALARSWKPGDRVLVTQLDHDGNVTPWTLAARDAGVEVVQVKVNLDDATLDEADFAAKLNDRTKLVAFTAASNSVGSTTPIAKLTKMAHAVGAEVYIDAVHWAPHRLIDVRAWDVDYCICSAYKFFGPHIGMLWGRLDRLEELTAYKLRPSPAHCPGKWMTGTQNFAAIAGVKAAIDYIASIGELLAEPKSEGLASTTVQPRRARLASAFEAIERYETRLVDKLLQGLVAMPHVRVFGITQSERLHLRVPTVVFVVDKTGSAEVATRLANRSIYCWHGHYYAVDICEALGQSSQGMVRLGILHTTTEDEIDRTLEEIGNLRV